MACHFLFLFSSDQSPWGEASCRFAETPGNPLERLRRADSGPSAKSQQGMRPPAYDHASAAEGHNRKERLDHKGLSLSQSRPAEQDSCPGQTVR